MASVRLTRRHIPEFDGLRGVAALAVVCDHLSEVYQPLVHGGWLHTMLGLWSLGYLGVDVFFVLSGFLITSILLEQQGAHCYRNFYMRRVLRLAPAYLLMLGLVWVMIPRSGPYLLLSLVYLANMAPLLHVAMSYGVLWSLSVEEHFYLVWPWLVRCLRGRWLVGVLAGVCVVTPVVRSMAALDGSLNVMLTWYRLDGLGWGALLAVLLHADGGAGRGWRASRLPAGRILEARVLEARVPLARMVAGAAAGGGVLLVLGIGLVRAHRALLGQSVLYSATAMLSVGLVYWASTHTGSGALGVLRVRGLRFVGDVSYWLYLTHYLALGAGLVLLRRFAAPAVAQRGWALLLLGSMAALVPTLITGAAVRRWAELPVLRCKSRFPMGGSGRGLSAGVSGGRGGSETDSGTDWGTGQDTDEENQASQGKPKWQRVGG